MKNKTSANAQKEAMEKAMEKLESAVREMYEEGRFAEYLSVFSRLNNYSFNNILLAYAQNNNISQLGSFTTWSSLGYKIKAGEKAIKIICPCFSKVTKEKTVIDDEGNEVKENESIEIRRFRLGNIFDISQCEGGNLPSIVEKPEVNTMELHKAVDALMAASPNIMFDDALIGSSANGFYNPENEEIHIKPQDPDGLSDLMVLRIIAHEYGHKVLHNKQNEEGRNLERGIKEIEAEATSFLCMSLLGFPEETLCYSVGYLAGWSRSQSTKELLESVGRIEEATQEVLAFITAHSDLKAIGA